LSLVVVGVLEVTLVLGLVVVAVLEDLEQAQGCLLLQEQPTQLQLDLEVLAVLP
jgi:hypothetical protein